MHDLSYSGYFVKLHGLDLKQILLNHTTFITFTISRSRELTKETSSKYLESIFLIGMTTELQCLD